MIFLSTSRICCGDMVCVYIYFMCSNHTEINIDNSIASTVNIFTETTGLTPKFKVQLYS